jgi:photosystem II stability/assembly factor-like uncharacterized protein
VSGIAFDSADENTIHISTLSWYDNLGKPDLKLKGKGGLYKSTDGGITWQQLVTCKARVYSGLIDVAVNDDGDIYTLGREFPKSDALGGIYKSGDDGKTWIDITGVAAIERYTNISIDPFDQDKIYVGTHGAGAFVGIDDGN